MNSTAIFPYSGVGALRFGATYDQIKLVMERSPDQVYYYADRRPKAVFYDSLRIDFDAKGECESISSDETESYSLHDRRSKDGRIALAVGPLRTHDPDAIAWDGGCASLRFGVIVWLRPPRSPARNVLENESFTAYRRGTITLEAQRMRRIAGEACRARGDREAVSELLDHGEWGIALEDPCALIGESPSSAPSWCLEELGALAGAMGMADELPALLGPARWPGGRKGA